MPNNPRLCEVDGCLKPAASESHRFCCAHYQRLLRGKEMTADLRTYGLPGLERLCVAAIEYADADSENDEDHRLAKIRLAKAATRYVGKNRRDKGVKQ